MRSRSISAVAERMLRHLKLSDWELSILLAHDTSIQALNREHRSKDKPTDVLSFPQYDPFPPAEEEFCPGEGKLLGDIVISLDTAERQAKARGHALKDEVTFLLAHGLLHLVGYDHQTDEEEVEMDALTRELVGAVSTNKPASR